MTVQIALLRAVNVGGSGTVAMAGLRDCLAGLGFANPRTLLQTGNLVFGTEDHSGAALEEFLEHALAERLGLETSVFVRTPDEWDAGITANPFPDRAKNEPASLALMALKHAPAEDALAALQAAISGPERVRAAGRHLYIEYPGGMGGSKLTSALIERKLGTRGTARNWNTVVKIAALARAQA